MKKNESEASVQIFISDQSKLFDWNTLEAAVQARLGDVLLQKACPQKMQAIRLENEKRNLQ